MSSIASADREVHCVDPAKKTRLRTAIDWVAGIGLIVLGVISGFVPFVQGWMLILAGLAILSSHSRWANAIYSRIKQVGRTVKDRIAARPDPDVPAD